MPHDLVGPEILPGTREYDWVARVVDAMERRTGRASSWNRRLYEELGDHAGVAQLGGPLTLRRDLVLEPVFRAYDANRPTDLETTWAARRGALLLIHEIDHHLHEEGDENAPDAVPYRSREGEALTEGLADSNRDRYARTILSDIGMDEAVPRIHDTTVVTPYGGYQLGVEGVLDGLRTLSGRSSDDVWEAVDSTPFAQRYNAMADVVIDSRLKDLMPPEHRSQIRLRLAKPLREELGSLTDAYRAVAETIVQLTDRGRETGARAVERLTQELAAVEAHYRAHGEHPPRMPMSAREHAQVQQIETFYGRPSIAQEPSQLRHFLHTRTPPPPPQTTKAEPATAADASTKTRPATEANANAWIGAGPGAAGAGAGPGAGAGTRSGAGAGTEPGAGAGGGAAAGAGAAGAAAARGTSAALTAVAAVAATEAAAARAAAASAGAATEAGTAPATAAGTGPADGAGAGGAAVSGGAAAGGAAAGGAAAGGAAAGGAGGGRAGGGGAASGAGAAGKPGAAAGAREGWRAGERRASGGPAR
ncbi:hypothetical protein [Kribbella sp. NPDC004536]|uniref:hypothetical protein n=1 Tax=Kribbella sp. NPDC004536 TaxID=3364106 RepID=UPI0036C7A4AB